MCRGASAEQIRAITTRTTKEHTMSITSDPLFVAAEVQWRFDTNSALYHGAKPARHGRHWIRTLFTGGRGHRHSRRTAPRLA
jgi:hypothetical protein